MPRACVCGRWLLADGTNNAVVMIDFSDEAAKQAEEEEELYGDDDDDDGFLLA